MDQITLVGPDLEEGRRLLDAVDKFDLQVEAAFWWLDGDTWKLILATPLVSVSGRHAVYLLLLQAIRASGLSTEIFERTFVESPSAGVLTIMDLAAPGAVPRNRLVLQERIGGAYVEGAYFYRFDPKTSDALA